VRHHMQPMVGGNSAVGITRTLASRRPASAASRIISSGICVASMPSLPPCTAPTTVARHDRWVLRGREALLGVAAAHVLLVSIRAIPRSPARSARWRCSAAPPQAEACWQRAGGTWRSVARGRAQGSVDMQ
jgi:hypothetical protein